MTQTYGNGVSRHTNKQLLGKARWVVVVVAASVVLWYADSAQAEHASIDLKIISPDKDKEVSAISDRTPPEGGLIRRPVMLVKAGDPLIFQYFLTNIYPHGVLKKVGVRYYIVRIDKIGQKRVPEFPEITVPSSATASNTSVSPPNPEDDDGVITHGEVIMNFKPRCRVGARMSFRIQQPGIYLVRVESFNTQSDHEHFSAIDLKVE